MPFQKGKPKTGGRKAGVQNKKYVLRVEEVLTAAGIDPISALLKVLPHLAPKDLARVLLDLQSYIEPKPKALDAVVAGEDVFELVTGDDADLLEALDVSIRGIHPINS